MSFLNSSLTLAVTKIVAYSPVVRALQRAGLTVKVIQRNGAVTKVVQRNVTTTKVIAYTSDVIILGR